MEFQYGTHDFKNMERGQENCYLLTNGLGGYSSLTAIGSRTRNDHALFMAAVTAPARRYHMISYIEEAIIIEGTEEKKYVLSSQEFVDFTKNKTGYVHLDSFSKDIFPVWNYRIGGLLIEKSIVCQHGENTLGISYQVTNRTDQAAIFTCTPWMQFARKGEKPEPGAQFLCMDGSIKSQGIKLHYTTNGSTRTYPAVYEEDYYYFYDARDGRPATGRAAACHDVVFEIPAQSVTDCYIIYSMHDSKASIKQLFRNEITRQQQITEQSGLQDPVAKQLVRSGDCFVTERESTGEKTILAGYPFFADWGRDTMIAILGVGITAGRYEEVTSIFRSFLAYSRRGLMPNMFPEAGQEPLYNTVDASLLFIMAVYEYYEATKDLAFVKEAWEKMQEMIAWYQKGTDFHISVEKDGLITAGAKLEQVTWMDVRYGEILPTPRHGKPVEINVWWYNSLRVMETFGTLLEGVEGSRQYGGLANRVRESFRNQFWNPDTGCLKDTVSESASDGQVRCNQIWAVSAPFSLLTSEQERMVVDKVFEELYTPYGLRTLSPKDPQFHPSYSGSQFDRDMAYHQGTVWPFPLGAYYLAYLKVHGYSKDATQCVKQQLKPLESCLREGCIGQIAEVYDGLVPGRSKGCFAQAWSVGELLRVYKALQKEEAIWS